MRTYLCLIALVGIALLASQGSCRILGWMPLFDSEGDKAPYERFFTTSSDSDKRTFNGYMLEPAMDQIIRHYREGKDPYDLWKEEHQSFYEEDAYRMDLLYIMLATTKLDDTYRSGFPLLVPGEDINDRSIEYGFPGLWADYSYQFVSVQDHEITLGQYLDAVEFHSSHIHGDLQPMFQPLRDYISHWKSKDQDMKLTDYVMVMLYNHVIEETYEILPNMHTSRRHPPIPFHVDEIYMWLCSLPMYAENLDIIDKYFTAGQSGEEHANAFRSLLERQLRLNFPSVGFRDDIIRDSLEWTKVPEGN